MKTKSLIVIGMVALIVIFSIYFVSSYNRFVGLDQDINAKWSEVENQYQRQADLIPNLVSVVSSAVSSETKFVKDVVAARTAWQSAQSSTDKDKAGVDMTDSVATFVNSVAESYPQFEANTQYVALTDELAGTQNRITTARGRYIEAVQKYNIATKKFPSNILAKSFNFEEKEYYQSKSSLETPNLGTGQLP